MILHQTGYLTNYTIDARCTPQERQDAQEALEKLEYADYEGQVIEFLHPDVKKQYAREQHWEYLRKTLRLTNTQTFTYKW